MSDNAHTSRSIAATVTSIRAGCQLRKRCAERNLNQEGSDVSSRSGYRPSTESLQQARLLGALQGSEWFERLDRRSRAIAQTVLTRDNGIESRHLALDSLDECFQIDPNTLHARFQLHAPALASLAAKRALIDAELAAINIDAVIVSTCTGHSCRRLTSYVIE